MGLIRKHYSKYSTLAGISSQNRARHYTFWVWVSNCLWCIHKSAFAGQVHQTCNYLLFKDVSGTYRNLAITSKFYVNWTFFPCCTSAVPKCGLILALLPWNRITHSNWHFSVWANARFHSTAIETEKSYWKFQVNTEIEPKP